MYEQGQKLRRKGLHWTYDGNALSTLSNVAEVTFERMSSGDMLIVRTPTQDLIAVDSACAEPIGPTAEELAEVYRILGVSDAPE